MGYLVHLRQFEGPLDLLLYLIRKEEMDIFDININDITHQFLEYIKVMKEFDLELAGDFVAMAATLIQIKSRMLLPQYNDSGEPVESEDPRKELVQKLLDYQKFQSAGRTLYGRPLLFRDVWTSGNTDKVLEIEGDEVVLDERGLFGLIAAFKVVSKRAERLIHRVQPKVQSIANRILEVKDRLVVGTRVLMSELLGIGLHAPQPRLQLLITFLSLLELGRLGFVSLFQSEIYGDIHIETKKTIDRNLLERVQEFEKEIEPIAAAELVASEMEEIDVPSDAVVPVTVPVSEEQILQAFDREADLAAQADLLASEDVATDDEIRAAELELQLAEAESTPGSEEVDG